MTDREAAQALAQAKALGYTHLSGWMRAAALGGGRFLSAGFSAYVEWRCGQNAQVLDAFRAELDDLEEDAAHLDHRLHDPLERDTATLRERAGVLALKNRALRDQIAALQRNSDVLREVAADFRDYLTRKETPA